jgi:hypothetical protein
MNRHLAFFSRSRASRARLGFAAAALVAFSFSVPGCGGSSSGPSSNPDPVPTPTPTPAPTPTPTPPQPLACSLTAPKVDCSTRPVSQPDLANDLQEAVDAAIRTPDVMYTDRNNVVYDLDKFRAVVVASLAAKSMCGAWDWGNQQADEIFVRSADGCVLEQYDLLTGDGGVRPAGKGSMRWQAGWGDVPVPGPKPNFPKEGDLACTLPGDRTTFTVSIKNTPGEYGREMYDLMSQVLAENPTLFDKNDYMGGQGEANPDQLRLPAWRILNVDGYIAKVEAKLRANGFCGYVEKGDILKIKKVSRGNIFHEEMDIVQNPPDGTSYVSYVIKDRCHNAGF